MATQKYGNVTDDPLAAFIMYTQDQQSFQDNELDSLDDYNHKQDIDLEGVHHDTTEHDQVIQDLSDRISALEKKAQKQAFESVIITSPKVTKFKRVVESFSKLLEEHNYDNYINYNTSDPDIAKFAGKSGITKNTGQGIKSKQDNKKTLATKKANDMWSKLLKKYKSFNKEQRNELLPYLNRLILSAKKHDIILTPSPEKMGLEKAKSTFESRAFTRMVECMEIMFLEDTTAPMILDLQTKLQNTYKKLMQGMKYADSAADLKDINEYLAKLKKIAKTKGIPLVPKKKYREFVPQKKKYPTEPSDYAREY